jgi:NAD(P)-dependent dehydrogenase (short-subunit alcohol dehydrogenase family)
VADGLAHKFERETLVGQRLNDKVVLITGSASGLGHAVARRCLSEGARVVCLDRQATVLPPTTPSLQWANVVGDVRNAADHQRAVELALTRFGRLDVLIANAGIYDNRRSFRSLSPAELDSGFDELFAINVKGYMLAALAAADALSRSRGSIIFTSSVSGSHAGFGGALYVSAKHAVNGLTRQLALELAPDIRVNAIAPGFVPTGLSGIEALGQARSTGGPSASDQLLQNIPGPDDYTGAYVFLASDDGALTATGTVLSVDGGASLRGPRR